MAYSSALTANGPAVASPTAAGPLSTDETDETDEVSAVSNSRRRRGAVTVVFDAYEPAVLQRRRLRPDVVELQIPFDAIDVDEPGGWHQFALGAFSTSLAGRGRSIELRFDGQRVGVSRRFEARSGDLAATFKVTDGRPLAGLADDVQLSAGVTFRPISTQFADGVAEHHEVAVEAFVVRLAAVTDPVERVDGR